MSYDGIQREIGEYPWDRIHQHSREEISDLLQAQVPWQIRDRVCMELLHEVRSPVRSELQLCVLAQVVEEERYNGR